VKGATGPTPGASRHFPGYDVLARADHWDPVTRAVVLRRAAVTDGPTRFFTAEESPTAGALLDRLLAQDDEPRVPVLALVDQRLAAGETDGWRYDYMPEDGDAWRPSLALLDDDAATAHRTRFADLARDDQLDLLEPIREAERWHELPAKRVWSLWMRYACAAFYSHPWAWNEIGFGGPAYPTGYKHLGIDGREPWEVQEHDAQDPERWAQRVDAARARHHGGRGGGCGWACASATSRRGCCPTTAPARTTACGATCAATTTPTRWTSPSWGAAPAAASSPNGWPGRGGRWWPSTPGRSGTPTRTG
jgi:hypothetical protein